MADKKDEAKSDKQTSAAEAPKKSKKGLFAGGGIAGLLALAYILSMMAVPKRGEKKPHLEGPFVARLSKTDLQVNLAGEGSKRYLVMGLNAEYFAYDEAYVVGRLGAPAGGGEGHGDPPKEDPLYTARLKDSLLKLSATKTRDQVTDPVLIDGFLEDIRKVVDPVLFPVYVGDSHAPMNPDTKSGLRAGESISASTLRGLLHDHALKVDAKKKTITFDNGPTVAFDGKESDIKLTNKAGDVVFVDVGDLKPEFAGEVPIGVPGKVRKIYRDSFLVQ